MFFRKTLLGSWGELKFQKVFIKKTKFSHLNLSPAWIEAGDLKKLYILP